VLKFAADPKEPGKPALVGLGLSFENLRRLRSDAIQFNGSDVGLGAGIFVIAHVDDPQLPGYQALIGDDVCELLVLTERVCRQFETGEAVVRVPLTSKRGSRACEAVVFAGETEQTLVDGMKSAGIVTAATKIESPVAHAAATVFRVGVLYRLMLAGGGVGFVVITAMLGSKRGMEGWALLLMAGTAAVFFGLLALRWSERIEITSESIRCVRPVLGFEVRWRELASIGTRSDSIGPYEVHLIERSGRRHKLRRIYERWGQLVDAIRS
jgi:hypothetical protein